MAEDVRTLASNEELALRAQQGCASSFAELVRRFQVPLVHFLRQRTRCHAEAEDLTQETLLRAYEKLGHYRPAARFSTWLFTLAYRVSLNARRRRRPLADTPGLVPLADPASSPGDVAQAADERRRLWHLAASVLSEEQFTALWLHYVEDMPVREIAHVLSRSEAAVKTGLFRARQKLLARLAAPGSSQQPTSADNSPPGHNCPASLEVGHE